MEQCFQWSQSEDGALVAGPGLEPGISAHEDDDLPLVHPAVGNSRSIGEHLADCQHGLRGTGTVYGGVLAAFGTEPHLAGRQRQQKHRHRQPCDHGLPGVVALPVVRQITEHQHGVAERGDQETGRQRLSGILGRQNCGDSGQIQRGERGEDQTEDGQQA